MHQLTKEEKEEEKMSQMIDQTMCAEHEAWLVTQIRNNTKIMIVSDGFFHLDCNVGASVWVIASESDTNIRMGGDSIIPGEKYL